MQKRTISPDEFKSIFSRVPRLAVEVFVLTPKGLVMTERSIEPCIGMWHIPGGTVRFGETLSEAVKRVAQDELGVVVKPGKLLGYIEYPKMIELASYDGWPVGMAFEAKVVSGTIRGSEQGEKVGYFKSVPPNTVPDQATFLKQHIF